MSWNNWNVALPADHTQIKSLPEAIRDVESSAKIIISKEHVPPTTSQAGGQHLKGSCRVYLDSTLPSTDPEGNGLATSDTSDSGRIAIVTGSSNCLKIYVATAAGISTGWQTVLCERVKLAETMYGNSKVIADIATATQSGQALHVGQLDSDYFVGISTGTIQSKLLIKTLSTGLVTNGTALLVSPYYSPGTYSNGESVTLPNGLIMKFGYNTTSGVMTKNIAFAAAFPTALKNVQVSVLHTEYSYAVAIDTDPAPSVSGFNVIGVALNQPFYWMAIGY